MKLLILSQYFWPESFPINNLSKKLHEQGHQVTVITGKPNYPEGDIYSGYSVNGVQFEDFHGIEVIRIPLRPRKTGALGLMANYMSFVVSGIWYMPRLLENKQFDAILVYAISPITAVIPAIWVKRKLGAHLVVWVQDLWPESLAGTGYVKHRWPLAVVDVLVGWIYKRSDTLLAQSHSFVKQLENYESKDKIVYYPNSIEPPVLLEDKAPDINLSYFDQGFSVVFAGNIGSVQAIPTLIEAASILSQQCDDCRLLLVGNGSMLTWAKEEVARLGLTNVYFLGRLDGKYMPWVYQQADALLVSLSDSDIFSYTIPSKLQSYLSAGKPIIASLNGEAADIIRDSQAGLVAAAEDPEALTEAIINMRDMSSIEREALGRNGKQYFYEHFDLNKQSQNLIEILQRRILECQ